MKTHRNASYSYHLIFTWEGLAEPQDSLPNVSQHCDFFWAVPIIGVWLNPTAHETDATRALTSPGHIEQALAFTRPRDRQVLACLAFHGLMKLGAFRVNNSHLG